MKSSETQGWTVTTELLAQLLEEVSILAADRRRSEPRSVPRPYQRGDSGTSPTPQPVSGHQKMLAAAMRRGMVRSG